MQEKLIDLKITETFTLYGQSEYTNGFDLKHFLVQFKALKQILKDIPESALLGTFLMLFFVIFQIFPIIVKLFLPYNEYDAALEGQHRILMREKL